MGSRSRGVDEHVWRHRRLTVIIDLTPVGDRTGSSMPVDDGLGRLKQAFKTWLAQQAPRFPAMVEIVAMEGVTGFKTAAAEELPDAVTIMDPFHVSRLPRGPSTKPAAGSTNWIHARTGRRQDPPASSAARPY